MEQVEVRLAKVGQNCNTRNLERIANNAVKMDTHKRSRGQSCGGCHGTVVLTAG